MLQIDNHDGEKFPMAGCKAPFIQSLDFLEDVGSIFFIKRPNVGTDKKNG